MTERRATRRVTHERSLDDLALVRTMAAGTLIGVGILYDRHGATLYEIACRLLSDDREAEEVVIAVFAQAMREAGVFRGSRSTVALWLTGLVCDHARRRLTN